MTLAFARIEQGYREILVCVDGATDPVGFLRCVDLIDEGEYVVHRNNLFMTDTIPSRFSKRVFDRVAPHIGRALDSFPAPVEVESSLSITTLARVVQEALTAKRRFGHTHPAINESRWKMYESRLGTAASQDGKTLLLGDRTLLRQAVLAPLAAQNNVPEFEVPAEPTQLRDAARVLTTLVPRPRFFVLESDEAVRNQIELDYDIAFTTDETNPKKHYLT